MTAIISHQGHFELARGQSLDEVLIDCTSSLPRESGIDSARLNPLVAAKTDA